MAEAILTQDVYSVFHNKKERIRYGRRGEKVKIVGDHDNVVIVCGNLADPFPVNIENIQILPNGAKVSKKKETIEQTS